MKKYRRFTLYLVIIAFFGCTPQARLTRLCNNYPLLCEGRTVEIDTLIEVREIPRLDTVKVVEHLIDTTTIIQEGDTIRVILRQDTITNRDTVLVTYTQKADTVYRIREKEVIRYKTKGYKWWAILSSAIILILGLWAMTKRQ